MFPTRPFLTQILDDEALTRGLADPEARMLIEWLVDRAELLVESSASEEAARADIGRLCRRARTVGRFIELWCTRRERGAACQLAAAERCDWPLPDRGMDPCELMHIILSWESRRRLAA